MSSYKIKVVTSADLAGITKTTEAIKQLTAATKSAAESAKVFNESAKSRNNASDQATYVAGLSKEAKEQRNVNDVTKETVGLKGSWIKALKQLKHDVPGLGLALSALKNPFTLVAAAIYFAINSLSEFNKKQKEIADAVGNGKLTTNWENFGILIAQAKIDLADLNKELDKIIEKEDPLSKKVEKARKQGNRQFAVEEATDAKSKAAELAAAATPEQKAAIEAKYEARAGERSQRKLGAEVNINAQAKARAEQAVREGQSRKAAETAALDAARLRHKKMTELADAQFTPPEKMASLEADVSQIEGMMEKPGMQFSIEEAQLYSAARGDLPTMLDQRRARVENARRGNQNIGILRTKANDDLKQAQTRFETFGAELKGSQSEVRQFGDDLGEARADESAFRPINTPNAGVGIAGQAQAQAAMDQYFKTVKLMFNKAQLDLNEVSRKADAAATAQRLQSFQNQ